jgi:hypothetical protein
VQIFDVQICGCADVQIMLTPKATLQLLNLTTFQRGGPREGFKNAKGVVIFYYSPSELVFTGSVLLTGKH